MHKALRKILISSISVIIVLITMVATTYAWVGMLSYSTIGEFNINLQTENKNSDYNLYISPTGEYSVSDVGINDSFKVGFENSDLLIIKKQILQNMGKYDDDYLASEASINTAFNKISLYPVTPTVKNESVDLSNFITYDYKNKTYVSSLDYFKFDVYLSIDSSNGEISPQTTYLIDLYIDNLATVLTGQDVSGGLVNPFEYDKSYIEGIVVPDGFTKIESIAPASNIISDSSFSTRLAIQYYEGIKIEDSYTGSENPIGQYIYQAGTQEPLFNTTSKTYSFGGVLESKNNLAIAEFNNIYGINIENDYNEYANTENIDDFKKLYGARKNDLLLEDKNKTICANNRELKLGIIDGNRYKVKLSVYFWYEGWDADCFSIIDKSKTSINLTFASNFNNN